MYRVTVNTDVKRGEIMYKTGDCDVRGGLMSLL